MQDGARRDIAANDFWGGHYERTFFDVRVFNPHAGSNRQTSLAACYRKHEAIKMRAYEQRVREVEHSLHLYFCHWRLGHGSHYFL